MVSQGIVQLIPNMGTIIEGLQCPKCGQIECFYIECSGYYRVTVDGVTDEYTNDWELDSGIECPECQETGTVREFTIEPVMKEIR